ncbi:PepSY domain-containing protein [Vibrio amylolyticus]|uniref:PepSY domain-containing protein n=1 Tax=Vibrio amylolyticus TaxID=2847292 RepID=UPI0035506AC3
MLTRKINALIVILTSSLFIALPASANPNDPIPSGHDLVQDTFKEGTRVEFDEDQDEVYDAVQQGLIKPFSDLYETVDEQLHGRVIRVELEEDDDEWIYELKLVHEQNVIKVEYNATTLEMIELKGRNLHDVIKK